MKTFLCTLIYLAYYYTTVLVQFLRIRTHRPFENVLQVLLHTVEGELLLYRSSSCSAGYIGNSVRYIYI